MAKATFNPKRLLVVHAHPDDESLFTGHVIADAVAAKAEVMVLTLTRGERGRMKLEELKSLEGNLPSMNLAMRFVHSGSSNTDSPEPALTKIPDSESMRLANQPRLSDPTNFLWRPSTLRL